ncbi:MAG: hypothetical protein DMF28_00055, partial [Verrucomicrobia bacterium]
MLFIRVYSLDSRAEFLSCQAGQIFSNSAASGTSGSGREPLPGDFLPPFSDLAVTGSNQPGKQERKTNMKPQKLILISIVLACFGLLPRAQAVSPSPDGCYPGFTTAEGCNALNFLTTGAGNTGVGWYSLFLNTIGNFNTGVGGGALALNNADSNTAVGTAAMLLNTTGTGNTAVGTDALVYN